MIKNVQYHVLRDYSAKGIDVDADVAGGMSQEARDNYIAFTCLLPVAAEGMLYCGVTAYNGDILGGFDLEQQAVGSLG